MAFCRNCGAQIKDGVKFCTDCGAATEVGSASAPEYEYNKVNQDINNNMYSNKKGRKQSKETTAFDKFSKFFGIFLLLIAIVDYNSDPPILTILLSLAIIAGAIFCLCQKYKIKGFTIIALILALFCFFAGISQGKEFGFLKVPKDEDYAKAYGESTVVNETPSIQVETDNKAESESNVEPIKEETPVAVEEPELNEQASAVSCVDPELKAFLDSYEEFMDEYIAFMKKYSEDPSNAVSMLTEYATIMEKYGDFAEKIDQYDEKEMSTEDAKYYLEVTTRVTQKMFEIY